MKSIPFFFFSSAAILILWEFKNASTLGYFNSVQALADYAEIITHVKETLNANNSLVIVMVGVIKFLSGIYSVSTDKYYLQFIFHLLKMNIG